MLTKEHATCQKCSPRWPKYRYNSCGSRPVCFKVEVSHMEAALGIEKFQCEKCGTQYVIKADAN